MSGQGRGDGVDGDGWVPPGGSADESGETTSSRPPGTATEAVTPSAATPVSRRARVAVALGAVVVVGLIGVGVGMAVAGSGDDGPSDEAAADETTADETTETSVTTTEPTTTTTELLPEWQTVEGVEGEFRVDLPADWLFVVVDDDATGAPAQLFPDDPGNRAFADGIVDLVATTGPRLVAADPEVDVTGAPPPMLALERQPLDAGLEKTVQTFVDAYADVGVTDLQFRSFTAAFGPVTAVQNLQQGRVDYFFVGGGQTWKMAYISATGRFLSESMVVDQIAMSFTASPAGTA